MNPYKWVFVVCITAGAMALAGCGDSNRNLIGKWNHYSQYKYADERCEFFKDKTCYLDTGDMRIAGRWSGLDDGRIKVELSLGKPLGETIAFAVVTGDELVLDLGGKQRSSFVREGTARAGEVEAAVKKAVADREIRIEAEKRAQAEKLQVEETARRIRQQNERAAEQKRQQEWRAEQSRREEAERAAREKQQEADRAFEAGKEAFKRGMWSEGIAELEKACGLGKASAYNDIAWHYATCKDPSQHDGKRAVEYARKALNMKPDNLDILDTLAAAYARNGQFEDAVKTQIRALSMGWIRGGEERLKLYRQNRAYIEK